MHTLTIDLPDYANLLMHLTPMINMALFCIFASVLFAILIFFTPSRLHFVYCFLLPAYTVHSATLAQSRWSMFRLVDIKPEGLPMMVWTAYGVLWTLRCAEVASRTLPHQVNCLSRFILYFSNAQILDFDSKVTSNFMVSLLKECLFSASIISIFKNLLKNDAFTSSIPLINLLLHNLICAVLTQEILTFMSCLWRLALSPFIATKPMMKKPMFLSQGIREFWGKRWNLLVHDSLKRSVHSPLKGVVGVASSYLAVFFASAVLHEYFFYLILVNNSAASYVPGKVSVFFLWNGVLCALEPHVVDFYRRTGLPPMPHVIVTAFTVLSALPLGGLFTDDWRDGGLFDDVAVLTPTIRFTVAAGRKGR
ncbi:hypothetical protein TrST_g8975 [Triparma strigata]|uniref:Wax synthase domain-containing protein n=1 Tax=Triparma strigata TaxID=1606541 RepID=A0A9W7BB14_9STRA|nr:hypothetical protein TrST_g8975 [Triparma strigata]